MTYTVWDNVWGFDYTPLKATAMSEPLVDTVDMKAVVTDPTPVLTLDLYTVTTADLAFNMPFTGPKRKKIIIELERAEERWNYSSLKA